jgi:hypothetical protein
MLKELAFIALKVLLVLILKKLKSFLFPSPGKTKEFKLLYL